VSLALATHWRGPYGRNLGHRGCGPEEMMKAGNATQAGAASFGSPHARQLSRRLCQGVKESKVIFIAWLWWLRDRLPQSLHLDPDFDHLTYVIEGKARVVHETESGRQDCFYSSLRLPRRSQTAPNRQGERGNYPG